MKIFLPAKTSREYIIDKHNKDTLFLKKKGFVNSILRNLKLGVNFLFEKFLGKKLYIEDLTTSNFSVKTLNTLSPILSQNLISSFKVTKLENLNLFVANITTTAYDMKGSVGYGVTNTKELAIKKSIAEFVERISCCILSVNNSDQDKHTKPPLRALPPSIFDCFDNKVNKNDIKFWKKGKNYFSNESVYVPLSQCYMSYNFKPNETALSCVSSNGTATESTYSLAEYKAILELIERDAFLTHWIFKQTPKQVDLSTLSSEHKFYLEKIKRIGIAVYMVELSNEFGVPVFGTIFLQDKKLLGISLDSNLDINELILKNFQEGCGFFGFVNINNIKYKHKIDSIDDIFGYWFHKKDAYKKLEFLFNGETKPLNYFLSKYKELESINKKPDRFKEYLSNKNLDLYTVDMSTNLSKGIGLYVVRALSPDLLPIYFGERYIYTKHSKILKTMKKLQLKASDLNLEHHPFI